MWAGLIERGFERVRGGGGGGGVGGGVVEGYCMTDIV